MVVEHSQALETAQSLSVGHVRPPGLLDGHPAQSSVLGIRAKG